MYATAETELSSAVLGMQFFLLVYAPPVLVAERQKTQSCCCCCCCCCVFWWLRDRPRVVVVVAAVAAMCVWVCVCVGAFTPSTVSRCCRQQAVVVSCRLGLTCWLLVRIPCSNLPVIAVLVHRSKLPAGFQAVGYTHLFPLEFCCVAVSFNLALCAMGLCPVD